MNDLLAILATWRLTHLLIKENGPADVLNKMRAFIGVYYDERSRKQGRNVIARAFLCEWCLSVWVGLALALLKRRDLRALPDAFAYSGGAIVVNEILKRA